MMLKLRFDRIALLLAVSQFAVSPPVLSAQMMGGRDTSSGPTVAGTGFSLGLQVLDVGALNAVLRANGFPTMGAHAFTTGFGTGIRFGKWDLSFSGSAVVGSRDKQPGWRTESKGSALMIGAGYTVLHAGRWRVIPNVGAGWTRISYHIEQVRGGPLDSAVVDPLRGTDLDGQTAVWHAGVAIDYRLGHRPNQRLSLTARAGYARPFGTTDWKADDNALSSGPRAAYRGIYARVGMSFGMPRRRDALIPSLVSVIPWLAR